MGLRKCWGGGGVVVQKYFFALDTNVGGGVMPEYFMDVEKCCVGGEGGYAKYFKDLKISPDLQNICS